MSDTLYRVAVSKDGRTELQDYSEADYNSNVIPYLESNYNPDDYSVARLSSADEDNLDDNAQYLVTATNDGGTQEQIYDGADLKTKLGDIRNMFPGQYKVRSIEGAVRRQAAADNTPAEDDWQGRLKQQTSGMAEMTASQMDRIADMANTPDLAERLARQDALKDLADSTVANVYKQVESTDEKGNTAEEWQLRTAEELQAFQQARDEERTEKAELRDILAQLKEIDDIDKKDTERWNAIVMDENGDGEVSEEEINRFAWDSSKRHQRKAELSRRLNNNKYYREEYDSRMALAEKVKKEAQPVIDAQLRISGPKALGEYNYNEDKDRATIEGRDTDALRAARFFANQTEKTLKAADDDTNGFMSFLQGAGATFSDADFWAFGLSSIVNNLKVKDAFDKIADKVQGAYSDESLKQYAEEGDFDKILSPDEVLMIQSFVNASQAQALRAYNTRGLYDSGKIAAESIGFMAQFLATGGVGKATSSGVTKFANWLTTKAVSSAVARGAGKAAQLATKGAIRLGQAIAEPAVAAIPMTLLQTGMYKGYAENLTARNDDGSLKYTYGTAILPAMRDAYKEVWSEQALTPLLGVAGKTINKTLGAAADATKVGKYLKTSVSKVTDALGNREALGILADAGFDGFLTEMGEEYLGALLESTWNKGALKDMLNWQEFGKMAAGFAPMSVLGAGASMANYVSRVNKYNKAESYIRNLLQEEVDAGRMQQEDMDAMLNRKTSTLADIGNKVSSIITPLVETRQFDEETFKALWDFAVATGEKEIAEACIKRVQSDRRIAMADIINERTGGKNIVSVVDGERTVSFVDDNGTRRYVLTDRTDSEGKYLSYDENGENPRFIDAESYGGLTTMTEDQFYDSEYDALAKASEQERMQTETEQNKQSLTDAVRAGESKLSLKDNSGEQREYLFSGWNGDNAVVIPIDEQGNPVMDKTTNQPVTETRSMQEVADALGMDVTVLTDAQIEQRKIDDMTAAESVVRMGNTQKGAAVEIDGVRGRLARFFARQNEDGTISYMANLVLRGKTTTIEVDKADIEALIEQRKMMTEPQKQDGKQIRKWERKDKLESDRAYSEAKTRFTNPDGSVRQSAFLAEDPENFARYSDENYGKADTDATLKANQTAMAQALLQAQQALDAEADPDAKNTLRLAAEQAQARLNTINDLVARRNHDVSSDGALSEEEARQTFDGMLEMGLQEEEIQALANNNIAEAKQAIEAIPAPQITTDIQSYLKAKEEYNNLVAEQQKKIDYWNSILNAPTREYLDAMEAERNLRRQAYNLLTRIGNAQTTETQEQLMKEYSSLMIDHAIAQSSADPEVAGIAADIQSNLGKTDVPVNVVTIANVLDVVKAKGISRENYNDLLRMLSLQHGKSFLSGINTGTTGFTIGGEVYLIADNCRTIESAKTTYFHERQHLINKTDTGLVNAIIANFGKDRNALLEALGKIHGTLGYESLDARSLADEISAYVMEQVLTGQDYARMLSEAGFDNNFIKLFENEQQRQQQPGFSINRYGNGNALFRTDAEGDGAENVGDVQGAAEQESDGYLPRTDDESRADAVAQGSGGQLEISEDASSPIRFSTSAAIEGAGLKYVQQDENGDFAIVFPDGRKMTGRDTIKGDDLKAIPNTVLGYMMADARAIGTITPEVEDMMWQRYADMLNAYLKSGLKENGGFENLIGKWQWLGETAYKTIASNSDKQYSFSMDITRVCKKNEAVINGIAELQKRQGYGATPAQIMDLYLESDALGYQVPCPVCYVFSRYINNGRYATVMINGQRKYGDRLADPSKLTEEERKEKIAMWVEELHTQEALNDQNASAITAAKKDIKYILEQIDDISKTLSMPGKRTKKQIDNLKKKAYALDVQYKAALDVVSQGSLDSWIKQFAIKENKDGEYEDPQTGKRYSLYDDTYQGFPEEVALDLRQTATAMREYPAIQRYRNSRGAGAGKEITFVANNDLGEVAMMLGSLNVPTVTDALRADTKDKIDLKYPPNYYKLAVNAKTEEQRNDYLAKARKRFLSAHLYAQQQSLRGGQRMWSWSDNIERLAPDVFLNMFQLRLAGGALQSYSKQLEGVKLVASLGGYVNGSLMGEGIGYREVSADEIETVDGKMYVKGEDLAVTDKDGNAKSLKAPVYEKDGKYYTLVFSKLIGIDAYGGNGKKGLFQLNQELDKAGNILVGMNDLHIEAAMSDDRVFFIIPWHASGADSHILKQMLEYLRVNLDNWKPFDYTGVQEEKKYKADDELNKYLIEFWNNHNYESKFACGIEGGIPSGKDGKLSPQQVHYRELRDAILRGKAVQDSEGKDKYVPVEQDEKWMKEIRNDIFLNQLYNKVRSSVDSEQMTSTDTGFIYPYEYWDTESNYWTADVNGERYLEYCRRLGFKPKFCGKLDGKAEGNGNFTDNKGFWKLLIDRRMYDTRGVYQDLTVVDMQDFNPDLVDPEQTAKEFEVTRVADEAGTQEIVDRVIERENNRLGGSARVNYGLTLDKAVSLYQTAKTKPAEYYSALAQTEGYVSEEEANEDRIAYRTVTDQKLIDELNSGELIEVYRAMQVIDGKLYPPMSAYVDGVLREPSERGVWEQSEEHPEQADENGNFLLEKGKSDDGKRKSLKAAYNPYYHTALNPINDQFSEAQNRSNMVIVKGLVPKSEIDNPYHAEKAKDSTGRVKWHKGPLAGILGQYEGKGREVILSRYFKPIDIVPESEIAEVAASLFKDTTLEKNPLPSNVFTPALRAELEKKGFTFVETDNTGELIDKPGVTWASVYGKKGLGNAGLGERIAKGKKLTKDQIKALEFIGVKPEDVKVDNNGSLMFRTDISPEVREEMDAIVAEAKANGTYLKAPNGADTKLTPEQWAMVRTENFKNWFGDWENDPENASKVVDENGEPMVVYHGSDRAAFAAFNTKMSEAEVIFMSSSPNTAGTYTPQNKPSLRKVYDNSQFFDFESEVKEASREAARIVKEEYGFDVPDDFFVESFRNGVGKTGKEIEEAGYEAIYKVTQKTKPIEPERPDLDTSDARKMLQQLSDYKKARDKYDAEREVWLADVYPKSKKLHEIFWNLYQKYNGGVYGLFANLRNPLVIDANHHSFKEIKYGDKMTSAANVARSARDEGYDGVIITDVYDEGIWGSTGSFANDYIAFDPNQIKSATDNNGEFNPDDPDIRFRTSVTPAQDAEYMSAVEAGDMEKAQQMVETAAEMAGYNKTEGFYFRKEFEPILPSENDEWAYRYGEHLRDKYGASKRAINWYTELDEIFEGKSVESFVLSDSVSSKAFFDAGLLGYSKPKMVFAQRIGLIRDIGKSYNYRDQRWEKGVSVLGIYEGNKFKNQNDGSYEVFSNGKKYIVAGLRISNTGADGEPLLVKAKIISDNLGDIKSADAVTYNDNGEVIPLSERFNPESNDIRFRTYYGGNSGYVGYSMSKRAFNAREDGAYPKTDFKKNYNISQPLLDMLVNAGVVSDDEWHHTSMYGNKTTFYRWNDFAYKAFSENRDAVESVYKDNTLGNEEKTALIKDIIDKAIAPIKEQFDALSSEYDAVRQTINTLNKESKSELDAYKAEVRSNAEDFVASNGVTVRTDENGPAAYDADGNRLSKRNGKGMRDAALKEFEERYDYYGKRFEFSKEQELSDAVSRSQDLNARMDSLINAEKESNGGVMFRTEYTPVVEIGRNGLSSFLEKKNSSLTDFIDDAWINYNSNKVDGSVAKQIIDMLSNGDTLNEAYLSVMADIAAKPILSEDEKAFATQSAEVLSAIAEEEISGNETLWAVYREARKDKTGMFDRFADIKVGRNLGTEPGIDPKDSIVDYLTEAGKAEADVKTKHKALMALADALTDIRTAMRAQREYDRITAQDMVTLSRLAIASGLLDDATISEVKRLLGIVKRTIGMTKIRGRVDELYNLILDNCLRNVESYYKTAMKRKPVKVNKNGVVAQGALDIDGQRLMETYKDALDMPVDDDGSGRKTIADRMNEAFDRYNDEDETKAHEAEVDINALSLAKRYLTDVVASLAEEKDMKQSLESAKDALKKGQLTEEDYKQLIKETKACITTTKADRLKALSDITQNLLDYQKASRGAAAEFSARQKEHIAEIYRDAERDMEGRPFDENPQTPGLIQKIVGSQAAQLFLAPLATFDMVFKMVGNKNAAGEGYLYNRFVRGWIDCSGAEQTNTESAFSELDEKVSEVFGKKMRWSDLYSVVRGMPQVECFFIDGGEKKSHMLTQGNLMYILLADNMEDGRMKLRNMGISEEDVEAIRKQMDPRFLELGRWVVEEFLPSRREAYNEVHMRMFGAPMSSVDNYFPLHILKGARTENVDVASANTEPVSPSTITGNIIKRTKNALALDVMGTDAFSAVIEHVQKMEHWRAFAEWNRDISTLLSNRKFRNRIVNMSSMYGYGEDLWKTFKDVCMVAAGSYSPKGVTKVDKSIMKIAKGVTAAKISLRTFTALKQFLSFPAYFSEANAEYLVKGIANPMKGWNWCMENLPLFRKRWLSRQAGDHILSTSEDWHSRLVENAARVGMSPNAFVDALTVSIGAYAIYQTKYRKYKDMGYSDETADRRAKQDATISYNETQQSNENAFLSPMQMDRSYATAMLTVFRNSSMGYTRQVADAARNLKRRMDKGYRERSIAFMTEQLINDGLDPAIAPGAARRMYARQGVKDVTRVAIFGYVMQFAWNLGAYGLYLLFGDDDDKKKEMLTDVAVHSLFGSIEGLSAGNVMSELGNMVAMGESLNNYDPTLMPLMSDVKNVISEFSRDNVAAINSIVNLVVQMGLGVNPQTIEDMVLAIIDAAKGDPVVAQEALILGMRLIEAPQSQIDQIYLDEIQLSAVDAQKMTIPELAERYARYKTGRGATLTGWLYTDAEKDEVMNKHIQRFEDKAKERLTADMANQRYVQLEEDAKALENRVTLLRQKAIQGDEQASAELNDIFLSEDYGRALRFQEQQKLINAKAKEAVEAPTVDEMLTALADIDRMKKQLYDDFAGEESPSYLKDQYVQYTKGILAQMAKLDKKYETEYIQRNPEYEKMMAQYQKDLDNAANEAKSNRERITELEEEKLKYRKPGKKTYFPRYKNRVKEINDSIKVLRSRGTSAASIMSKVKKSLDVGEEAYMPSDILNSDEFRAYLAVKDLGSISGNTFVFKEVADLEQKIKEAENPETKAKLAKRRDDLMGRMAQLVSRELNNVDDSDEVIE